MFGQQVIHTNYILAATGNLLGKSTTDRRIPLTKAIDVESVYMFSNHHVSGENPGGVPVQAT